MATSVPTHTYQQLRRVRPRSDAALIRGAPAGSEDDLELLPGHWPRAYRSALGSETATGRKPDALIGRSERA